MSEKITFQELIESIADQTNKPKQFTHDFLKDFVAVINSGLESDGTISIAGFGKFKLRPMDEREGYNPQTGEKITIPAHNKVVFKPYKELRELVNAPYRHLEPELFSDETGKQDSGNTGDTQERSVSASSSSPLSVSQESEHPVAEEKHEQTQAPWELSVKETEDEGHSDAPDYSPSSLSEETAEKSSNAPTTDDHDREEEFVDNDIVEYSPDIMKTDYEKYKSASERKGKLKSDELQKMAASAYSYEEYKEHKKKLNKRVWLATAACLVLLVSAGVGAWYFNTWIEKPPFDLKAINFFKTAADTQQVTSSVAGQLSPSASDITDVQVRNSSSASHIDTKRGSLKPASTKQVITKGQTLWSLADQQYDNPYLWPWIYDENKSSIINPDLILAGQTLALPLPRGYNGGLSTDDSLQVAIGYIETYRWYKNQGHSKAKYYLYAARMYNGNVFEYTDVNIDDSDMAFANRAR